MMMYLGGKHWCGNWAADPMPNTSIIDILEKWAAFSKTNPIRTNFI